MDRITLNILGRDYPLNVESDDVETLTTAAELINARAEPIRKANRGLSSERVAVMAALQIAYDSLIGALGTVPVDKATIERVSELRGKCEELLQSSGN